MPRARATAGLASLIESDSEPDLDFFDDNSQLVAPKRPEITMSTIKKPRGRPAAANRVTKLEPKTKRRTSGRIAAAIAEVSTRDALADKSNSNNSRPPRKAPKQTKQDTELPTVIAETPMAAIGRPRATRGRPKATGRPATASADNSVIKSVPKPRGRRLAKKDASIPEEIPETQVQDIVMAEVGVEEQLEIDEPSILVEPVAEFGMCDVSARRRLGELTRKYESLQTRHQNLQEVGVTEAERNFERLRKESDERTSTARTLIAELKAELRTQTTQAKQGESYKKQLEESKARAEDLQATIDKLNKSLDEAKLDIKTLSTKLAASRSVEANGRVPGSALKAGSAGHRPTMAQAKEDLYGDLTGLIMRDVRRNENDDIFDCIQTGRNGTLHFKLSVKSTTKSSDYDSAVFTYKPQLDDSRDEELMDLLPDFLVEEIEFPRPQASKFYARVMKSMTERLE